MMHPIKPISVLSRIRNNSFGLTPIQSETDGLVGNFTDQAADGKTLAAMTVGGFAYRLGKIGVMALGQSSFLRPLSVIFGLGTEVTAFEFTNRVLNSFPDRAGLKPVPMVNLWIWEGIEGWKQGLFLSTVTFGLLKGAGHLAQGQNLILQHLFQDAAIVSGYQVLGALDVTPKQEGAIAEQLVHAEATNLQMQAGMGVVPGLFPGWMALERGLDLSLRSREIPFLSKWEKIFPYPLSSLAIASAKETEGRIGTLSIQESSEKSLILKMSRSEGKDKGGTEQVEKLPPEDLEGIRKLPTLVDKARGGSLEALWNLGLEAEKGNETALWAVVGLAEDENEFIVPEAFRILLSLKERMASIDKILSNINALKLMEQARQGSINSIFMLKALQEAGHPRAGEAWEGLWAGHVAMAPFVLKGLLWASDLNTVEKKASSPLAIPGNKERASAIAKEAPAPQRLSDLSHRASDEKIPLLHSIEALKNQIAGSEAPSSRPLPGKYLGELQDFLKRVLNSDQVELVKELNRVTGMEDFFRFIGKHKMKDGIPLLTEFIRNDPSRLISITAVEALEELGNEDSARLNLIYLTYQGGDPAVKSRAALALFRLRDPLANLLLPWSFIE